MRITFLLVACMLGLPPLMTAESQDGLPGRPLTIQNSTKGSFLQRWALHKCYNKLEKIDRKSKDSDGQVLATACLAAGGILFICWAIAPVVGFVLSVPVGLIGIILGVIGLIRARRPYGKRLTRILAATGVFINLLAVVLTVIIWQSLFGG